MSCEDASSVHKESPNPAAAGELASDSHLHYFEVAGEAEPGRAKF